MAVLPIVTGTETPVLRTPTKKIQQVTKEIQKLLQDMRSTVTDANGAGIAATQVGRSERIALALFNNKMNVIINPEITWRSEETVVAEEGCLSLPGMDINVERSVEITVRYLDEKGQEQERRLKDWDARVVQHEVDHLDGILIADYAGQEGPLEKEPENAL